MSEEDESAGLKQLPPITAREEASAYASSQIEDSLSIAETKQLSSGLSEDKLKRIAAENEANRTEKFRDHFERLAVVTLYLVWIILILVGLAWVYHLLAPPCWPRLPDQQVQHLQSIITGGVLAGIAGGHFKRRISGE